MPSYIIHLCVAKEYARKYYVEDEEKFLEGVIYPDSVSIKGKTHYSPYKSSDTNLYEFLLDKKLNSSYNEGYFSHLLADCLFYNKYFLGWRTIERTKLLNDFDVLNQKLIQEYNLTKFPKEAERYSKISKEGETIEYHYDKVVNFIEEVSNFELHNLAEKILKEKDYKFLLK